MQTLTPKAIYCTPAYYNAKFYVFCLPLPLSRHDKGTTFNVANVIHRSMQFIYGCRPTPPAAMFNYNTPLNSTRLAYTSRFSCPLAPEFNVCLNRNYVNYFLQGAIDSPKEVYVSDAIWSSC